MHQPHQADDQQRPQAALRCARRRMHSTWKTANNIRQFRLNVRQLGLTMSKFFNGVIGFYILNSILALALLNRVLPSL